MNILKVPPERRREYLRYRRRTIEEIDRAFLRHERFLGRLERYCGKKARLFDSRKCDPRDSDEMWSGLVGIISRATSFNAMSPYTLMYWHYERGWAEHYTVIEKIRRMEKDGVRLVIDTEWVDNAAIAPYYLL